ncbi:MAG: DUF2273 domain-containing protein [Clostridia bacterium]|nr:DUF2273 domain-containing protein [Clostridia bacterium]
MNENNNFFIKNLGAIIGIIIGLILACTNLYRVVIVIMAVIGGAYVGKYIQYNKEEAKDKMKKFIDKL